MEDKTRTATPTTAAMDNNDDDDDDDDNNERWPKANTCVFI